MRFQFPVACSACGQDFPGTGHGTERIRPAKCPKCGADIHIIEPLSVSPVANRILLRSQNEMDEDEFTMSIVLSAMAVECILTQAFMKWKEIENPSLAPATEEEKESWEKEYRKQTGGFQKSADFVSDVLRRKRFDDFVTDFINRSSQVALIKAGLQNPDQLKSRYIHEELFDKRNRIMHWGKVTHDKDDALRGLQAARNVMSIIKLMDVEKQGEWERKWRESQGIV